MDIKVRRTSANNVNVSFDKKKNFSETYKNELERAQFGGKMIDFYRFDAYQETSRAT